MDVVALQHGIFRDQGLNPCLLHRQADSLPLSYQGSRDVFYEDSAVDELMIETPALRRQEELPPRSSMGSHFPLFCTSLEHTGQVS